MKKQYIVLIIIAAVVLLIGCYLSAGPIRKRVYLRQAKQELLALANDQAATDKRVAKIGKRADGWWTDGRVGITGDGYIFYYRLHDLHTTDGLGDINVFYLQDEKRFIVNHKHFCVDISKAEQPKNKAELLPVMQGGSKSFAR